MYTYFSQFLIIKSYYMNKSFKNPILWIHIFNYKKAP